MTVSVYEISVMDIAYFFSVATERNVDFRECMFVLHFISCLLDSMIIIVDRLKEIRRTSTSSYSGPSHMVVIFY